MRGQWRNKRDANEPEIVAMFRAMGCTVARTDQPVDLIVGYRGVSHLVEVKVDGGRLNASQREFKASWRGDFAVVRSIEDVREVVEMWRNE
jgi:hypothetical protein